MSTPDSLTPRRLNLVFQGGGIRGIAYAGILEQMPSHLVPHAVGGTSAGAIVAALLAIGKKVSEIKMLLNDSELYSLLSSEDLTRQQRIKKLWQDVQTQLSAPTGGTLLKRAVKLAKFGLFCITHWQTITIDLADVWGQRGLHNSTRIRNWLDKTFGQKTFADTVVEDLRIVAADVSSRAYDKKRHPAKLIAEAVHASISIPGFFPHFLSEQCISSMAAF